MLITSSLTAEEMEMRVTSTVLNLEEGIEGPETDPVKPTQLNQLYSMITSNIVVSSNHVLEVLKRLLSEIWKIQILLLSYFYKKFLFILFYF